MPNTTTLNQYGKQPGTSRFFKVFEQIINAHKKVHQTLKNTEFLKRLNAVVLNVKIFEIWNLKFGVY